MLKIGQSQPRFEDDTLVRGQGRYTADIRVADEVAMVVVRSQVAAGRILSIDTAAARAMPLVLGVFTGADLQADGINCFQPRLKHPGPDGGDMRVPAFLPLSMDAVHYVGDPLAIVIAETRAAADDAAEAVIVMIEDTASVVDALDAIAPDAPAVWSEFPDNRCFNLSKGDRAGVDAAIAGAHTTVQQRLRISRVTAAPIEMRSVIAEFDPVTQRYRLDLGTQAPHRIAADLAPALGVAVEAVHVVARDCGGSFGMKNAAYPEYAAALWAARRLARPVRWAAGRLEAFQSDAHARDQWADATLALDAQGRFLALDVVITANLGAYLGPATTHPPVANLGGLAGVYRTPNIHVTVTGVFTNTQQTAPYRGAGRPEATYIIERMIDIAAFELGMDRAELRRRNMIARDSMPYGTGFLFSYDSGDFPGILHRALEASAWAGFDERRRQSAGRGLLRGIGIANPIEIASGPMARPNPEFARLNVEPNGQARLLVGSCDTGQGHGTAFRQILADRLGLDPSKVEIVTGDTRQVDNGTGTFGSRTMGAAGTAIWHAADSIVEQLRGRAANRLETDVGQISFGAGLYRSGNTGNAIAFIDVLSDENATVSAETFSSADGPTFPNGCHVCEVEIDPDTGRVHVLAYCVVDDVGVVINPMLVKGQIAGGVAQGLGQALMENAVYDRHTGQLLSATFMDYALPRAIDLPDILIENFAVATQQNPLGVKGAGEAGTVGALAAVISAVCHALQPAGIRHLDMPATAERVWRCMEMQRKEGKASGRSIRPETPA